MLILAMIAFGAFLGYKSAKQKRVRNAERVAASLHRAMQSKLQELEADLTMTELKWREWLPIFEAADEECWRLSPRTVRNLGWVSDEVRELAGMDD